MNSPTCDTGLGTLYERWAIHQRLRHWLSAGRIRSALEGPWDGFAGMPGLHLLPLARRGVDVTVVLEDEAALSRVVQVYERTGLRHRLTPVHASRPPQARFDAVVSFNMPPLVPDWRASLAELAACVGDVWVVFVTHPLSYGTFIRRAMRRWEHSREPELFDHESTRRRVIEPELSRFGRIAERAWVDCPWWPDLFVRAGQSLWSGSLARFGMERAAGPRFVYGPDSFPVLADAPPPELARALRHHPVFERAGPLAAVFAHHRAYLVEAPTPRV